METKIHILIVDDNEKLSVSLRDILEDEGYAVEIVYNGKDAIALLQNNRYDITLVDYKLPDISGAELVDTIASISSSTEFILMTAQASTGSAINAVSQERVISYELKPLNMDRLLSILNQVVKRRKAEDEIRKLTHAIDYSSAVVVITDTKGNIEYANPRFAQHTGYSLEDAIGENPRILKSGKTSPEVFRELWKTIISGNEWRGEFCNRKKNGELYWESASISPVKNSDGSITHFVAVKEDVTERKLSDERVESLANILEDSLNEIHIFDAKTLRFIQVNKGARLNLGYSIEELSTLTPLDLKPEVTVESFAKMIHPLRIGEKEKIEFATVHRRKDGSLYDVEVHLQLSTFQSNPVFVAIILDVTERKEVEESLQKSEARYRDVAVSMSDWIWEVDVQGKYTYASSSIKEIMGYEPKEILGKTPFDLMTSEESQRIARIFAEISSDRKPIVDIENWNITKDGREICLLTNGVPMFSDEGRFIGYRGVDKDITGRKQAERELKELNESLEARVIERTSDVIKLSHAVEQSASTVVITDVKGNIEYVNPMFTQTTGYTFEEVKGNNTRILNSGIQKPEFYEEMWIAILSGNEWRGEFRNMRKNGELYWELASISSIKNKEGVIINFVAVKEDITKQKQLETELLQSADLIRLLQDINLTANEADSLEDAIQSCLYRLCSSTGWPVGHAYMIGPTGILKPSGIWYLNDIKKYHEFQEITKNTVFNLCEGLPGRVLADLKPHWIIDVTTDDNFPRVKAATNVGLKGAFAFPVIERGRIIAVLEFFSEKPEKPDKFIISVINQLGTQLGRITERKQAEAKLKESMEEALRTNKAKSVFLSSMSHELRTPMNSILGFAQLLDEGLVQSPSELQKESIENILKSGNHLLDLINDILDLSGIESGMIKISMEDIEVDTVINYAVTSVESVAAESSIKVNYRRERDKKYIMADNTRLKQVLINLLTNAIKYNKSGGSVTIWIESPTDEMLRINVKDTGPGILNKNHYALFEPFNRLGAESLNIEGTGVGLTITKRLVEMMGGSIGVESEEGKGARFYVDFMKVVTPGHITDNEEVVAEEHSAEIKKEYTMLYVEDNPSNLKLVENILQRRPGISLLTASQAQLGIELAKTHQPDLILMDINLPGMNGYEALKLLKSYDTTKNIQVIAISANAMPEEIKRGMIAGFKEYITKPINVNKFLDVVDTHLMKTKL